MVASFVLARTIRNGLFLAQWDAHRLVYVYVAVPLLLPVFVPLYTFFAAAPASGPLSRAPWPSSC